MKTYLLLILNTFFFFNYCFSQAPAIEWQNTIGGDKDEAVTSIIPTADYGYFLAGYSNSDISDDKTENAISFSTDFWIMKIDSSGNIQWQNTIGGFGYDYLSHAIACIGGGYLLVGYSNSGISGDKYELGNGGHDIWVVKVNAIGNIEWQNTIGGSGLDDCRRVIQCSDGNYIIAGRSDSNISGDKTENSQGGLDNWILKLNSTGSILWQNTIGGSSTETIEEIIETADNEIMVFGDSFSDVSGDKTIPSYGNRDFWVLNLDSLGNILWQKVIGGSGDEILNGVVVCPDGGYLLGGNSTSSISGDKSEINIGGYDFWIVKISDEGIVEWEETIGGISSDNIYALEYFNDGYIIGGNSLSGVSGDKTEPTNGGYDYWFVKIDSLGNIIYQKAYGGNKDDAIVCATLSLDGNLILGGYSYSGLSGDKSEPNLGGTNNFDIWLINLMPECIPATELCNSLDDNCNGLIDDGITETISISAGGPITFCQGSSVSLTATYSGATVQWKKNGTNIPGATSATYNVTTKGNYSCVTTSACGTAESTPIFVNVIKNPNASISAGGPTTFCAGGSVVLTEVAVAGCTYQWYKGASPIAGATSLTYTATTSGNYKCRVTKAATGCYKNSNAIAVSVPCREGLPAGEAGELVENETVIYPNPALNVLTIKTNNNQIKIINLYDALGRLINSQIASENEVFLNVENLPAGTYFIQIVEHQIVSTYNFIKQ
ncbi:MAG: T9SS type A sorting domain-containing protein [Bacteroidetes bacterium]|nr:T9SS type A sorting domain-containing protein [Bacteroidota bacterium]